jgi:hypothetical protein
MMRSAWFYVLVAMVSSLDATDVVISARCVMTDAGTEESNCREAAFSGSATSTGGCLDNGNLEIVSVS